MASRLAIGGWSIPAATVLYIMLIAMPVLLAGLVPAWRRRANVWGRAHPILQAGIGAAVFGLGFATWSGWLTAVVVAAAWFAVWVLLGRASQSGTGRGQLRR
ncbi:MAG TPA: hypothetical protein VN912_00560 [Candidatus Angelobacter sp.]|nr:hypothetical protein [Candidatus Angelobacter sp.]